LKLSIVRPGEAVNSFVGRPFQAVVVKKTDNFDALKRASYSFHGLERSTYAMPVAHTTVIGCAGLPALTETRNFKSDASGNDEIKTPLVPTDSRSLPTDTGGKRRTYDHVA
jgi:hypothetical protein